MPVMLLLADNNRPSKFLALTLKCESVSSPPGNHPVPTSAERAERARRQTALVAAHRHETRTGHGRCSLHPGCRTDPYSRPVCLGPSAIGKPSLFDRRRVALQASENFSQHSCLPAAFDSLQNRRTSAWHVYTGRLAATAIHLIVFEFFAVGGDFALGACNF